GKRFLPLAFTGNEHLNPSSMCGSAQITVRGRFIKEVAAPRRSADTQVHSPRTAKSKISLLPLVSRSGFIAFRAPWNFHDPEEGERATKCDYFWGDITPGEGECNECALGYSKTIS